MNKIPLIGIVIVATAIVIAAVILRHPAFITLGPVGALLGVWIYLVWLVRKRKASIFHDQMETGQGDRRYRMLKVFLWVAGVSLAVGVVGVILHNVLSALLETEEAVSFGFALTGLFVFVVTAIGGLVVFITGRIHQRTTETDIKEYRVKHTGNRR